MASCAMPHDIIHHDQVLEAAISIQWKLGELN
jgi:hypothetical protein